MEFPPAGTIWGPYGRISRDDDPIKGLGVTRQQEDTDTIVNRYDGIIHRQYQDNDYSAYDRRVIRPDFQRLLNDLRAGVIQAVAVWDVDRLVRQPRELETLIDIAWDLGKTGRTVWLADAGGVGRLDDDNFVMQLRIKIAFANKSAADTGRRVARKHLELATKGLPNGGTRSFGYAPGMTAVMPEEAEVVREIAQRLLAGSTLRSVAAWLNEIGCKTAYAGKVYKRGGVEYVNDGRWDASHLKKFILKPALAGVRVHRGTEYPAAWEPILSMEEHVSLQQVLNSDSPRRHPDHNGRQRKYLLPGFVYCGLCGKQMRAQPRTGAKTVGYVCIKGDRYDGCGGISRAQPPVDALVSEWVLDALERDVPPPAKRPSQDTAELISAIARDEDKLDDLAADYAIDVITRKQFQAATATVRERLERNRKALLEAAGNVSLASSVRGPGAREAWKGLPLDQKRAIIAELVDQVVIYKPVKMGPRFDPTTIKIVPAATHDADRGTGSETPAVPQQASGEAVPA